MLLAQAALWKAQGSIKIEQRGAFSSYMFAPETKDNIKFIWIIWIEIYNSIYPGTG